MPKRDETGKVFGGGIDDVDITAGAPVLLICHESIKAVEVEVPVGGGALRYKQGLAGFDDTVALPQGPRVPAGSVFSITLNPPENGSASAPHRRYLQLDGVGADIVAAGATLHRDAMVLR